MFLQFDSKLQVIDLQPFSNLTKQSSNILSASIMSEYGQRLMYENFNERLQNFGADGVFILPPWP